MTELLDECLWNSHRKKCSDQVDGMVLKKTVYISFGLCSGNSLNSERAYKV